MDITAQIHAATDPHVMRRLVLRALARRTEETLSERERVLGGAATPDRLTCLVAVFDEASAYWSVETRGELEHRGEHPLSVEEYREIAADTYRLIGEQIGSLIVATLTPQERARLRAQVIEDMRGPGDED